MNDDRWRPGKRFGIALLALVATATDAGFAQSVPEPLVTRWVRVTSITGQPLEATLVLTDSIGQDSSRSNAAGAARFVRHSSVRRASIRIARVGFAASDVEVTWGRPSDTAWIRLEPTVLLQGVETRDSHVLPDRLRLVDNRIAARIPSAAITRADIERRNPVMLTQMLRGIAGVLIGDSAGVTVAKSTRGLRNEKGRMVDCIMRVSIDGIILPASTNLDNFLPVEIHAIEVFNGPARIPPEMSGIRSSSMCGLIALWTRSG
ncbi:MAG: hypothetical protein H7Z40_19195 [Phycisphaerae bacterium]|nr:hypothetical protein [Gemmatimonadaceae bacterium]